MSSASISNEHEQDTVISKMSNLSIPKSQSIDHLAFSSSHDSSPCCSSDLICKTPSATTSTEKTFATSTSTSSSTDTSTSTSTSTSSPSFPPLSLAELVQTVQSELQGRADMSHVRAAMKAYDESRNEWKRYEFFDSQKKYTRNLIATDYTTYTLMLLCWNPERGSPVHDHAGSECFMRVVMGNVKETQYHWAEKIDQHLKIKEENILKPGDVAYINDSIGLHKVENTFTQPAVTLHLYMPPYESCQLFMDETGKATESFVTFYSENGEIVEHS